MSDFIGIIIFIVVIGLIGKAGKSKGREKTKPASTTPTPTAKPVIQKPLRPVMPKPAQRAEKQEERKYYDSTCMDASSRHDHDRRMEQLEEFLRSGIISREEYRILKDKFENA